MPHHLVAATPETVQWGRFDAAVAPVVTIASGDTVEIECFTGLAMLYPPEGSGMHVSPKLRAINDAKLPVRFGHLLTGPVAVEGAKRSDVLEVQILDIALGADWAFNAIEPLEGTIPDDFKLPKRVLTHIPIDQVAKTARLPFGPVLTLNPFFGVMGVAPPAEFGELSSREPRLHGGNLDNKELTAGSTLFLPVWAEGGLFSCGDGHGTQGDGEVCVTALETALTGTFRFVLHKSDDAPPARLPRAETPTHFISMGFNSDLDEALRIAVREMIDFMTARSSMSRQEAYQLCSLAADFHVTQSVNGEKGVHGMLPRHFLA